jgi:hypothetical protein
MFVVKRGGFQSNEVIYEAVFAVKSFYGQTLTATPQRLHALGSVCSLT